MRPSVFRSLAWITAIGLASATGLPVHAGPAQDNCTGYIDSLPTSITSQGTWCLRGTKFPTQTSGAAINVLADNVTIDCNGFRISGLGSGATIGVGSGPGRQNITVRQCVIEGFSYGIQLFGDGHVVEDNHVFYSWQLGIDTRGDGIEIRNNYVGNTSNGETGACGISAYSPLAAASRNRVIGNTVSRTSAPGLPGLSATGISASGLIQDNLVETNALDYYSILLHGGVARDNVLLGRWPSGVAILGMGESSSLCRDNDVLGYLDFTDAQTGDFIRGCQESGTNVDFTPGH